MYLHLAEQAFPSPSKKVNSDEGGSAYCFCFENLVPGQYVLGNFSSNARRAGAAGDGKKLLSGATHIVRLSVKKRVDIDSGPAPRVKSRWPSNYIVANIQSVIDFVGRIIRSGVP